MANYSYAKITLYVPAGGLPKWRTLLNDLPAHVAQDPAFLAVVERGGVLVLEQDDAPWGNPFGIRPEQDFHGKIDADYDVGPDLGGRTWKAYQGQLRGGDYQQTDADPRPPTYPVPQQRFEYTE